LLERIVAPTQFWEFALQTVTQLEITDSAELICLIGSFELYCVVIWNLNPYTMGCQLDKNI
jgi:hypothetical protein